MKVVFLDIDGVVATEHALYEELRNYYQVETVQEALDSSTYKDLQYPRISMFYWPFDPRAISQLYRLQKETKCKFVLSSSWRLGQTIEEINKLFAQKGLRVPILDKTDRRLSSERGEEIAWWIRDHKDEIESYVIIDDECNHDIIQFHPEHCVNTIFYDGFTKDDCDKAIEILNK